VNSPHQQEPKITIFKDGFLGSKYNEHAAVSQSSFAKELSKRNVTTLAPVHIKYEHQSVLNMTFIVTPNLDI
jgi:hypothetical protein